jgi:hypothetical protein
MDPNYYSTKARYAGFMLRTVLELKFQGNRLVGQPRRWFFQLLENEQHFFVQTMYCECVIHSFKVKL